MKDCTYDAILKAHGEAMHVIHTRYDLRVMQQSLAEDRKSRDTAMNEVAGHLIGEGLGDLDGAWDHLVDAGEWSKAATVAMLGRDASEDPDIIGLWSHRFQEAERRMNG